MGAFFAIAPEPVPSKRVERMCLAATRPAAIPTQVVGRSVPGAARRAAEDRRISK